MSRGATCVSLLVAFAAGGWHGAGGRPVAQVVGLAAASRLISVDGSLDFGEVPVGDRRALTIRLVNSGTAPLTVRGLHISGGLQAHTSASWSSGTVAAGASQPIRIWFAPFAPGPYRGFVTVVGDQTSGASTMAISATVTDDGSNEATGALWRVSGLRAGWRRVRWSAAPSPWRTEC